MPPDRAPVNHIIEAISGQPSGKNRKTEGLEFFATAFFYVTRNWWDLITELLFRSVRSLTRAKTEMLRETRERHSGSYLQHYDIQKSQKGLTIIDDHDSFTKNSILAILFFREVNILSLLEGAMRGDFKKVPIQSL